MNPAIILPSVEAGLQIASWIQQSYSLMQSKTITEKQLMQMMTIIGFNFETADKLWEDAGKGTDSESVTPSKG